MAKEEIKGREETNDSITGKLTSSRKLDHLRICLEEKVESRLPRNFDEIHFVHRAIPEFNFDEISTETVIFGKKLALPLVISGMTGGHPDTAYINENLAKATSKYPVGLGVGSQRATIEKPELEWTFATVKGKSPLIIANFGIPQLDEYDIDHAKKVIEMVGADVLALHANALQEAIQLEGQKNFGNSLQKIEKLSHKLKCPIIVKEVGSGISREDARRIGSFPGIKGVDVGGLGGTSWSGVEVIRNLRLGDSDQAKLGNLFWDWGIPTPISVAEVRTVFNGTIIATGGIRNGLDIAKTLALGADVAGMALPFLKPAVKGENSVLDTLRCLERELKIVMFLTGSRTINELRQKPLVITGNTREWLEIRGIDVKRRFHDGRLFSG